MDKIKILILAANAWKDKRLDLGVEQDEIQDLWNTFDPSHERFDVCVRPAASGKSLLRLVLGFKPHLIHFSGHGKNNSLVFADISSDYGYEVSKQTLAQLFQSCAPDLKAVFLNACHSAKQADAIVEQVDYLIGMNALINDLAAISFSKGFYTEIFTQTINKLDIAKAYEAGRIQMAIDNIDETEQAKPIIQKRLKTYVSGCKHDIFISFANEDKEWTNTLTDYLRKQLIHQLGTTDGFQMYMGNDFSQLEQSATLLIIASPAYCQQQLPKLKKQPVFLPVFLVEYEVCQSCPETLKGFTPHKFWLCDNHEGMTSIKTITGYKYNNEADKLATTVAKQLIELKDQQQPKQRQKQQLKQQQDARAQHTDAPQENSAFVFLLGASDDSALAQKIAPLLERSGINHVLSIEASLEKNSLQAVSAKDIDIDRENQILNCNAIVILYDESSLVWVRHQLSTCKRLDRKRKEKGIEPLKVIAVHNGQNNPDLGISIDKLHICHCPPRDIETYLPHFIEVLA